MSTYPLPAAPLPAANPWANLIELFRYRAEHQSEHQAYTYLDQGETIGGTLTYGEIDRQGSQVAAHLQTLLPVGSRILLTFPNHPDFLVAFTGCLYGGMVSVPVAPPQKQQHWSRFTKILDAAGATTILTNARTYRQIELFGDLSELGESVRWLTIEELLQLSSPAPWQLPHVDRNTLVFLQFTSGSTGDPKGVMVSHGNLLNNFQMLQQGFGNPASLCMVTWLPFFHDWGLIGGLLFPFYLERTSCIFFDPSAFLYKPLRWLQAISHYRANVSCAPNFAYELCLRQIEPEEIADLDLLCWEVAMVGAEPVRSHTLEEFSAHFAPCGFRHATFYPSYGLAEATLFVTGGPKANPPVYLTLDRTALAQHRLQPAAPSEGSTQTLVSSGRIAITQKVIVVNPETRIPCSPREIGEIWIAGPSVTQGYWRQTQATEATFFAYLEFDGSGPFLRTGDLGFLWNGALFITGRAKDVIILAGRNYYPQDIELSVEQSHPSLRPDCGTAFSIEVKGVEHLVIVQELNYGPKPDLARVIGDIQKAIARGHGIFASAIVIVKPGTIPKTSSGKIKRRGCRQLFLDRQLDVLQIWQKRELEAQQ